VTYGPKYNVHYNYTVLHARSLKIKKEIHIISQKSNLSNFCHDDIKYRPTL